MQVSKQFFNFDHQTSNMGQSMEGTQDAVDLGLAKTAGRAAWVIYSTVPERVQMAAFYNKDSADRLHQEIYESEAPVIMDEREIEVLVDEYAQQIEEGLTPYTVILENGELLREDTYDSEIFNITEPHFEADRPELFSGTFWASSISEAVEKARSEWSAKINK